MTINIPTPGEVKTRFTNYLLNKLHRQQQADAELIEYCSLHQCGLYWNPETRQFEIH